MFLRLKTASNSSCIFTIKSIPAVKKLESSPPSTSAQAGDACKLHTDGVTQGSSRLTEKQSRIAVKERERERKTAQGEQ